jgi:hypothetical protein
MKSEDLPYCVEGGETHRSEGSDSFGVATALSFAYLVVALTCLIQGDAAHLWARVDLFSGGYLGLRFLGALYSLVSSRQAFKSKSLRRQ